MAAVGDPRLSKSLAADARVAAASAAGIARRFRSYVDANRVLVTTEVANLVALMEMASASVNEALACIERIEKAEEGVPDFRTQAISALAKVIENGNTSAMLITTLFGKLTGKRIDD